MSGDDSRRVMLELVRLTKTFGTTKAVDEVSLEVRRGSTFGLIGPNGAGKSTLMKMIVGVLRPSYGRALVAGIDSIEERLKVQERVGYVPEVHTVDTWMRVDEVLGFCRAAYRQWNEARCRELLERFELVRSKRVRELSKGMQVKLSLVLAVSHEPELLLLDEPMAGLDPLAREEFLDGVLATICEQGQTVVMSTHSLDDVQRLADTVGILLDGRLLVESKIDELLATTRRIRATLVNGHVPERLPEGVIWHEVQGREWTLTVEGFGEEVLEQIQREEGVGEVEVMEVGLEGLFKDIVRGRKAHVAH